MQAEASRALGSELTARVCDELSVLIAQDEGPIGRTVREWPGDPSFRGDSVPLRLCGALHGLVLDGVAEGLRLAYEGDLKTLGPEIAGALHRHETRILEWLKQAPQTNEVGRSAVLILGSGFLAELTGGCRFDLLELGASAGLNLNFPKYRIGEEGETCPDDSLSLTPILRGEPPPTRRLVAGKANGVDLHPLDPVRDRLRLMAYIWPDQQARLERMRRALQIAGKHPPHVDRDEAAPWLERQLSQPADAGRLVYHTIAAQYFPRETRERIDAAMAQAGRDASIGRPLARLSMEDEGSGGPVMRLQLWQGKEARSWHLGRAHAHAAWIDWQPIEET